MDDPTRGPNRTGARTAPGDVAQTADFARHQEPARSATDLAALRGRASAEADPGVGSVPPAPPLGEHPALVIDKLGERLAFERLAARLYDALIAKAVQTPRCGDGGVLPALRLIQARKVAHVDLLGGTIDALGADPTAQTPAGDLAAVMASGWLQVVTDPRTDLAQCLNVMLVAELADQAGWDLLVGLVAQSGAHALAQRLEPAAAAQADHVNTVRGLLEASLADAV